MKGFPQSKGRANLVRHWLSSPSTTQLIMLLGLLVTLRIASAEQDVSHDAADIPPIAEVGAAADANLEIEVVQDLKSDLKNLLSDFDAMLKADEANDLFDQILLDQVDDMLAEEDDDAAFLDQLNAHVENTRHLHSVAGMALEDSVVEFTRDLEQQSDLLGQRDNLPELADL